MVAVGTKITPRPRTDPGVIRASNDRFRVAWIERRYENASLAATERWTAILTIVLDTSHDAERLRKNPLSVFAHAINWSKELG
jgi:type IV secretion system protein VirB5